MQVEARYFLGTYCISVQKSCLDNTRLHHFLKHKIHLQQR